MSGAESKGSQTSEEGSIVWDWGGPGNLASCKVMGLNLEKERARYLRIMKKTCQAGDGDESRECYRKKQEHEHGRKYLK